MNGKVILYDNWLQDFEDHLLLLEIYIHNLNFREILIQTYEIL